MINQFLTEVRSFIASDRIFTDDLRRLAWGTDAGFYRLIPKAVIQARNEAEVARLVSAAAKYGVPVTFRAAGTSLSGQSITDSVLIIAGKGWEDYKIGAKAETITLQPGIIGARVNQILAPYGRLFTPDPASKSSAMVGGIVINNASGMNCGIHANSDKILQSMRIVLADGTVIDTAADRARSTYPATVQRLLDEIMDIRKEIMADSTLVERIRYKYSIKNVTGLNLLPFVTYDNPWDIIAHVMVGSEGTLGFMSEVTVKTGILLPYSATAMVYFRDMAEACRAVVKLKKDSPVYSCEMFDKKSLATVHDTNGSGLTALLIETKSDTSAGLSADIDKTTDILNGFDTFKPVHFTTDPKEIAAIWKLRSGIFPAVGGTRPAGTTALIEDIAFHIDDLPAATSDLAQLLIDCGYDDACIYGHALEGNYHFIIAQSFETQADIGKYAHLMQEIEHLVIDRYDGSLKAEHGTGRNMAPFVEKEWGSKAFSLMKRIKAAFDPYNILNTGVIFNDDPECYIRNLKPLPLTNPKVDKCIECGFCEVNCVSCGLTLSARQRIVIQREISRLRSTGEDPQRLNALESEFRYLGNETCAGDGLCSTSCPMSINTGEMIHDIRQAALPSSSFGYKVGNWAASHLGGAESALKSVLYVADLAHKIIGDKNVDSVGKAIHRIGVPLWTASLPGPNLKHEIPQMGKQVRKVVYFPSCINQTMGASSAGGSKLAPLTDTMVALCNKAGFEVIFPQNMSSLCCGMIWESKGMPDIADKKTAELEEALLKASDNGKYPVLCDQSPCLHRMRTHIKSMHLYEPVEFISDILAPYLDFHQIDRHVAIHITCSTRLMGLGDKLVNLAKRCSRNVLVPEEVGCCGFAGDKGFTHPELNKWGLRKLKPQIMNFGAKEGYSNSRTCEIGLTTNSGIPYQSIAYLVNETTTPKTTSSL